MHRTAARTVTTIAALAAAALAAPLVPASAAPVAPAAPDAEWATGVITAKGGLVGRLRPSTHAPANYTFEKGAEVSLDCRVRGTVVDGNPSWYLVGAEGDANWVSARYVSVSGPAVQPCDPSDGTYGATAKSALKKRVGPTTADSSAGTYAKGKKFRVQCFTDEGQKWYFTDGGRWVSAKYVKTSSKVRFCSNF
jgi:hypothetical protein